MKRLTLEGTFEDLEAGESKNGHNKKLTPQRYILLPGEFCTPQKYQGRHPNLSIADSRLAVSPETQMVNPGLRNLAPDSFIVGLNFDQTVELYNKLQPEMFFLSPWYFSQFYNYLCEGIRGTAVVKYEDGKVVPISALQEIKSDISEKRNPLRGHWLYARFVETNNVMKIIHPIVQATGKIELVEDELDEETLKQTKRIDLESWGRDPTLQGLVKISVNGGSTYYWSPKQHHVPWLTAYSGWVGFGCIGRPRGSLSSNIGGVSPIGSWPARIS